MVRRQLSRKTSNDVRRRSVRLNRQRGGQMITVRFYDKHDDMLDSVKVEHDATVLRLKKLIAEKLSIPDAKSLKLSIELDNNKPLNHYGINTSMIVDVDYEDKNALEQQLTSQHQEYDDGEDY